MTVYGYCAYTPAHRLIAAGAHGTFGRMTDLPELLLDGVPGAKEIDAVVSEHRPPA
jgi:hypothetical protein